MNNRILTLIKEILTRNRELVDGRVGVGGAKQEPAAFGLRIRAARVWGCGALL